MDSVGDSFDLSIFTIDCLYDVLDEPLVKHLFMEMVKTKVSGYGRDYRYGTLPLDAFDFFATHHLVCAVSPFRMPKVLSAYKTVSWEKCKIFGSKFPAIHLLESSGAKKYSELMSVFLNQSHSQGKRVDYIGSYAMPDIADPFLKQEVLHLYNSMVLFYQQEKKIDSYVVGSVKKSSGEGNDVAINTFKVFKRLGFVPFTYQGEEFSSVKLPSFDNVESQIFQGMGQYPDRIVERAISHHQLWESRKIISSGRGGELLDSVA